MSATFFVKSFTTQLFAFWPPHHPHLLLFSPLPFELQPEKPNLCLPFLFFEHIYFIFVVEPFSHCSSDHPHNSSLPPPPVTFSPIPCLKSFIASLCVLALFIDSLFNDASSSPRMEFPEGRIFVLSFSFRAVTMHGRQ